MQTSIPKDLPRRMRYYQSMIDIDSMIAGVNRLFFNASAFASEKNLEIKGFLGYLCSGKPSDYLTEDIDRRVERLKINEIFRSDYMMDALPLYDARQAGLKEGMALGEAKGLLAGERKKAIETAKNLLKKNISAEIIAECTGLSLEEVIKIKDSL